MGALDRHITGNYGEDQAERGAKKPTPRQIADKLVSSFHERMVQCSAGGAEAHRGVFAEMARTFRVLGERPRVTRSAVYREWQYCCSAENNNRRIGRAEVAAAYKQAAEIIDAYL